MIHFLVGAAVGVVAMAVVVIVVIVLTAER